MNSFLYKTNPIVPFPPTNLQLTQKNSTSVTISWKDDPQSSYYKIVISPPILSQISKYGSTSFMFNSLSPSTTYNVIIYSGKNNPSGGAETYETVGMFWISLLSYLFSIEYLNNNLKGNLTQFTTCPTGSYGLNCERILFFYFLSISFFFPSPFFFPSAQLKFKIECYCNNHGVCSEIPSIDGSCTCNPGYTTPASTTQYCTICSDGYLMVGSNCVQCNPSCQTCDFNSTHCTS